MSQQSLRISHEYKGPALLSYLEDVDIKDENEEEGFYMPVQRVCRPDHTFRGFRADREPER